MDEIFVKANKIFKQNFLAQTSFERAIFFSWYCSKRDCKFCYMSSKEVSKDARRTVESLLAEAILCKKMGWKIGFVSGGHDAYTTIEFEKILKLMSLVSEEKLWINIGPLKEEELRKYTPYIDGVVASIETINPKVHEFVCPSKPVEPFVKMFSYADQLGLKKAMTIILGIGESMEDYSLLREFILKNKICKIHFYTLNPQEGTYFEHSKRPNPEYQALWIARTRIDFPKIDIQAGIWLDCVDRVPLLLEAGANSISKFPAIRHFGGAEAQQIEEGARKAGREFVGTLIKMPTQDFDMSRIPNELRDDVGKKLQQYLKQMRRSIHT